MSRGNNNSRKVFNIVMVAIILVTMVGGTVIAGLSSLF